MSSQKWKVPKQIETAIELIEQQLPGSQLNSYGVREHRYVLRSLVRSFSEVRRLPVAVNDKDGRPVIENGKPKMVEAECLVMTPDGQKAYGKFLADESNFVCYASNAKKLLIEAGVLDKAVVGEGEYE